MLYFSPIGSKVVAHRDEHSLPYPSIRHSECSLLLPQGSKVRCQTCSNHRQSLNILAQRFSNTDVTSYSNPLSHVNYRYLSTLVKDKRLREMHRLCRSKSLQVTRLRQKLTSIIDQRGINVGYLHDDFCTILRENSQGMVEKLPKHSFKSIFWLQQLEASTKNKPSMRWHPAMIKWCLYLRHQSSKAYEVLRESGTIVLPSQRTLRDYTHYVQASVGFSYEVDQQLAVAAKLTTCKEYEKLVVLLLDEMHVREDLIYEKHSGTLIGFSNLGEINTHLLAFEKEVTGSTTQEASLAKTVMVFMVQGIFTNLKFPYAQFPVATLTGDLLFDPFWEAISRLERLGLKVRILL